MLELATCLGDSELLGATFFNEVRTGFTQADLSRCISNCEQIGAQRDQYSREGGVLIGS